METTAGTSTPSWDEVDDLISILRARGITYLVGLEHPAGAPLIKADQLSAADLIQRLARCNDYPRVRDACISLFLLHPELASAAQQAMRESLPGEAEQIATLVLATLYLQRLWSIRLAMALGHYPGFPEQPFAYLWERRLTPSNLSQWTMRPARAGRGRAETHWPSIHLHRRLAKSGRSPLVTGRGRTSSNQEPSTVVFTPRRNTAKRTGVSYEYATGR